MEKSMCVRAVNYGRAFLMGSLWRTPGREAHSFVELGLRFEVK